MSLIHCNNCGIEKSSIATIEFYCASCRHVLCKDCSRPEICPIDNRPFKGIKISRTMPPNLRAYFEDPNKFIGMWQKCIRFQSEQRALLETREYSSNLSRTRQLKNEIKLLRRAKDFLKENVDKDTKRIDQMKAYLKYCIRSRGQQSFAPSRASTSASSLNFSSFTGGESGVDLEFDESSFRN